MQRITVFVFIFVCCLAFSASAQNANIGREAAAANPCSTLGPVPTVKGCWGCFQSLLDDCDGANPNAERRNACYTGANNFFTWCLGRVSPAVVPAVPVNPRRGMGDNLNLRQGFAYQLVFSSAIDATNIEVYVRDFENGKLRIQQVKSFAFTGEGNQVTIFFDNNNIGIEDDKTVGIITLVRNPVTQEIDAAYADAFDVSDPLDLNGDGTINLFDYTEAWNKYANGDLSFNEFIDFVSKYVGR